MLFVSKIEGIFNLEDAHYILYYYFF